ncbi:hypothetical protein D3C74_453320 [compost metagenome]
MTRGIYSMRNGYIRRLLVRLKAVFIKMAGRLSVSSWRMNICMLVRQWIRGVIRRINIFLQGVMEKSIWSGFAVLRKTRV